MKILLLVMACFLAVGCKTMNGKNGLKDGVTKDGTVGPGGICKRDALCQDGLRCRMRNLNPDAAGVCVKQDEPGVKGEVCGGMTGVTCHKTLTCRVEAADPAQRGYCVSPIATNCPDTESIVRAIANCQTSSNGKAVSYKSEMAEQFHICQIDRALIDVWSLFRTRLGYQYKAPNLFLEHPASGNSEGAEASKQYCEQLGGKVVSLTRDSEAGEEETRNIKICSFSDCSSIYVETLFLGPNNSGNAKLTAILKHEG